MTSPEREELKACAPIVEHKERSASPDRNSGKVWNSSRFTGRPLPTLHAHKRRASAQDVLRCVDVSMVSVTAMDAFKGRLALATSTVHHAAFRAGLRRVGGVHELKRAPAFFQLVSEHGGEHRPTLLKNGSVQTAFAASLRRHSFGVQVFQDNMAVVPRNVRCGSVYPVLTDASLLGLETRNTKALLCVAIGTAFAAAQNTLSASQTRFRADGQVCNAARGVGNRVGHPSVYANRTGLFVPKCIRHAAPERHIPSSSHLSHHNLSEATRQRPSATELHKSKLRHSHHCPLGIQVPHPTALRVPCNPHGTLAALELRASGTPGHERPVCFVSGPQRLSPHGHRDLPNPFNISPKLGEFAHLREETDRVAGASLKVTPPVTPLFQRQVVDEAASSRVTQQYRLLIGRRVQPVAVSAKDFHSFNIMPPLDFDKPSSRKGLPQ